MKKIKLGSLCTTNVDKHFKYGEKEYFVQRGTYVSVCDDADAEKGFVLVETESFDKVFGYKMDELTFVAQY